jgi:hypothetical protein
LDAITSQGGACSEIDRWYNGGWVAHINGYPFNNFTVQPSEGYFVKCTQSSTFVPGPVVAVNVLDARSTAVDMESLLPATDVKIDNVLVTNHRDTALTISWRTDMPSDGWVAYGATPDLGQAAYDERGAGTVAVLHQVTLAGLAPETTYYLRVHSGDASAGQGDQSIRAETRAFLPPGMPLTAFGQVTSKGAPAAGALVSAQLIDLNGKPTELLSTLVEASGYWALSLPLDDCAGVTLELQALGADGSFASLTVPACQAQPAPVLQLNSAAAEPRADSPSASQK